MLKPLMDGFPQKKPIIEDLLAAIGRKGKSFTVKDSLPQAPILEEARDAHQRILTFLTYKHLLQVPDAPFEIVEPPSWDPFWGEGMMGFTCAEILRDEPMLRIIVVPPTTGIDDRWTFYWEQLLGEEGIEPTMEYQYTAIVCSRGGCLGGLAAQTPPLFP